MKIALTGASSRIGQTIRSLFKELGHEVFSLVRNPVNESDKKFDLSQPTPPNLLHSMDLLVHIGWDRSRNYEESIAINRIGGLKLLDACAATGTLPVLLSTMSVHASSSKYGMTKSILEDRTLELSGRVVRSGLIWGDELSGFLLTIERIAKIPIIRPQLLPDPDLYHSEVNTLAECIAMVSLSGESPTVISAVAKDLVKLSELMMAMGSKHGIKMPVPVKMVHKASERLERLGLKLPFNSDSISGILENINEAEIAKFRPRAIEFPDSSKFLAWASSL
jgi:dTDP-4-dehydrorhamnose reductase